MAVSLFLPSCFPHFNTHGIRGCSSIGFVLAVAGGLGFLRGSMSTIPTADLLALDTDGIAVRLSKLRGYL